MSSKALCVKQRRSKGCWCRCLAFKIDRKCYPTATTRLYSTRYCSTNILLPTLELLETQNHQMGLCRRRKPCHLRLYRFLHCGSLRFLWSPSPLARNHLTKSCHSSYSKKIEHQRNLPVFFLHSTSFTEQTLLRSHTSAIRKRVKPPLSVSHQNQL